MKFRTVALAGVALLAIVAVFIVFVLSSLDGIVKAGIEKYGSEILGTSVRVDSVKIRMQEGKGTILGLRVASPGGFPPGDAIRFGEITLGIDIASLSSADPIVINVVNVADPSVSWVVNSKGKSNISVLKENATNYGNSQGGESTASETSSDEPPTLISIKKFSFTGGKLNADLAAVGGPELKSTIAPVELSNVGGSQGETPGRVGATIAGEFAKSVLSAVSQSPTSTQLNQFLGKGLDKLNADKVKGLVKGLFD
jgi:hypothetical protein